MPDIPYPRADRERQYVSITKHHRNANNDYSKWIDVPTEQRTFDAADYGNHSNTDGDQSWMDNNCNLWGFLEDFESVGTYCEQFGFFPATQNLADPWHGYPVIPFKRYKGSKKYDIPDSLIELWIRLDLFDIEDYSDLINGRRL